MGSIKSNLLKSITDPDLITAEEARKELEENNIDTKELLTSLNYYIITKSREVKIEKGRVRKEKFERLAAGLDSINCTDADDTQSLSFSYHKKEGDDEDRKDEELFRGIEGKG